MFKIIRIMLELPQRSEYMAKVEPVQIRFSEIKQSCANVLVWLKLIVTELSEL